MKIIKVLSIAALLISIPFLSVVGQQVQTPSASIKADHLEGLTRADQSEIQGKNVSFDGEKIPVYDPKGNRVRGMEMVQLVSSGDFVPEFYWDGEKEIKAIVLREATEQEAAAMKRLRAQSQGTDAAVGKLATDFSSKDMDGQQYSLSELKGKVVVINFWFIGCKPCVAEIPELNKVVQKYKDREDVVFLAFALDSKEKIAAFLKKKPFNYEIFPGSHEVAGSYNISGYPTHLVIDQSSKIAFKTTGLGSHTVGNLERAIEDLLEE